MVHAEFSMPVKCMLRCGGRHYLTASETLQIHGMGVNSERGISVNSQMSRSDHVLAAVIFFSNKVESDGNSAKLHTCYYLKHIHESDVNMETSHE